MDFASIDKQLQEMESDSKVTAAREAADPHDILLEELLRRLKAMNWDALDEETLFAVWRTIVKGGRW
jgi:predicted AlkP superfamily pyrophosphatase or phosphodiesterase